MTAFDARAASYPNPALYIDGRWLTDLGQSDDVLDPATEAVIARVPHATPELLDLALQAAERALVDWRRTSPFERAEILRRAASLLRNRAEAIGRNITLDEGKILPEAVFEVRSCADLIDWYAEEGRRAYGRQIPSRNPAVRQTVLKEPIGVCVAFTPWNFPASQATHKIAPALAAGCTIVLKGPEETPSACVALAQAFHDAGLPAGCLNVVFGDPAAISRHLVSSPLVRKVSFTGSTAVGKQIAALAGAHMKRTTMELGGHAPVLVLADADLDQAASSMLAIKNLNAGQVCVAPTRFFVDRRVCDRFVGLYVAMAEQTIVGDGLEAKTSMGPMANVRRIAGMERILAEAVDRGTELLLPGGRYGNQGYFWKPSVLFDPDDGSTVMSEEPFGPISAIVPVAGIEEAVERANRLPYGLAAYVFTQSARLAAQASDSLAAGMVGINHFGLALPETPFGGVKESGYGMEGGAEGLEAYLAPKFVSHLH